MKDRAVSRASPLVSQLGLGPLPWLFALSAAGLVAASAMPETGRFSSLCGPIGFAGLASAELWRALIWSPATLFLAWFWMVVAMMPPLVSQPVSHVWQASFRARRARAVALLGLGYAATWMTAGLALVPTAVVLVAKLPDAAAAPVAILMAVVWSASPPAQAARNRCHRVRRIGAFGRAADWDCLAQGVSTGGACVVACWPWMIVPMTLDGLHVPAMIAVTVILFAERLSPAGPVRWRIPPAWEVTASLRRSRTSSAASSFAPR